MQFWAGLNGVPQWMDCTRAVLGLLGASQILCGSALWRVLLELSSFGHHVAADDVLSLA